MKKRKFFYSFLLSYIVILLIPCFIFIGLFLKYNSSYVDELLTRRQERLNNTNEILISNVRSMGNIAASVMADKDFSAYRIKTSPGSAFVNIENTLSVYTHANDFIGQLLYYSKESNYVYGLWTISLERFFSSVFSEGEYCIEDFEKMIKDMSRPDWLKVDSRSSQSEFMNIYSIYFIPVERDTNNYNSVESLLIFFVQKSAIENVLNPLIVNDDSVVIISHDDTAIYSSDLDFEKNLDMGTQDNMDKFKKVLIGKEKYYYLVNKGNITGQEMKLEMFIPISSISKSNRQLFVLSIISLMSTIVLGLLIILYSIKRNYLPIKDLSIYAQSIFSDKEEGEDKASYENELSHTRSAIDKLLNINQDMIKMNSQYEKERVILKILNNPVIDRERLYAECDGVDLEVHYPLYCSVVIYTPLNKNHMKEFLSAASDIEGVNFAYYNNLILIIGTEFNDDTYVNNVIDMFAIAISEVSKEINIGVGNFVEDISSLNSSYCQALIALNQAKRNKNMKVFFKELNSQSAIKVDYEKSDLEQLYKAIVNGNLKRIDRKKNFFKKYMLSLSQQQYSCVYVAHDIINTCTQALNDLKIEIGDLLDRYTFLLHKHVNPDVEKMVRIIDDLINEVIAILKVNDHKKQVEKIDLDIEDIKKYIKLNYTEVNFSVQSIADEFDTSISNLSHYFKSNDKKNISTYICELRIINAKKLLEETDLPLSQIIKKVGVLYESNFIRNFKKFEGCTPGQYRKKLNK